MVIHLNKKSLFAFPLVLALLVSLVYAPAQVYMFPNDEVLDDGLECDCHEYGAWDAFLFIPNDNDSTYDSWSYFPDCTGDGVVNVADVSFISTRYGCIEGLDECYCLKADLTRDSIVDMRDLYHILYISPKPYSFWEGMAHDASNTEWRTAGISQGIGMGGEVHPPFRIGTSEGGASDGGYLEIWKNESALPEDGTYKIEAKIRVKSNRTAYWDLIPYIYNQYGKPLLTIGVNFHWQYYRKVGTAPAYWSPFNNSDPYSGKRGVYNDVFFDFAL